MAKRSPITMYFDEEQKAKIKAEAEREGKSVSDYCRSLFLEKRAEKIKGELKEEFNIEDRLEKVMADGLAEMKGVAEDIREQNGLVIHLLREIEDDLDGVDVDADVDDGGRDLSDRLNDGDT